jgi:hypothetical protein
MAAMFEDQRPVDTVTLVTELGQELDSCGGGAYIADLDRDALPANFSAYVRTVGKASRERRYNLLCERLTGGHKR